MTIPKQLCIFCEYFEWSAEEMWGMGSTQTGPMMSGGDAQCYKGHFETKKRDEYIDRYCGMFGWRWTRKDMTPSQKVNALLKATPGHRLTYKALTRKITAQ